MRQRLRVTIRNKFERYCRSQESKVSTKKGDKINLDEGDCYFPDMCGGGGYYYDPQLISKLRKADKLTLLAKTEKINGSDCYIIKADVIEAEDKKYKYKLWVDKKHGYNLAKFQKQARSINPDTSISTIRDTIENVRFKEIDGVWVPIEWDYIFYADRGGDGHITKSTTHIKRTKVLLNPDHDVIGSFVPDIPDGWAVRFKDIEGIDENKKYTWQDGKVVDESGNEVDFGESKAGVVGNSKQTHPTAMELVDKYAETQDKIYKSFLINFDITEYHSYSDSYNKKVCHSHETYFDGGRFFMSRKRWGNCVSEPKTFIPKDDFMLTNWLWNSQKYGNSYLIYGHGHKKYNKSKDINKSGQLSIYKNCPDRAKSGGITDRADYWVRGFYGTNDIRIDKILREAKTIVVQDQLNAIGKSKCYVIDAVTKYGKYKVWIDPEHSYNIARVIVTKGPGDLDYARILEEGTTRSYFMRNVHFERFSDTWITVKAETGYRWDFSDGSWRKSRSEYKRIKVVLNPDFDENDFTLDIPDGWVVKIGGFKGIDEQAKYTWRDGTVVDEDGNEVDLEKFVKETKGL